MRTAKEIINEFKAIADNPRKAMDDYKKETGKGAVGIMPVYCPEEIVHAAGYLPIGMWGAQKKQISKARTYLPPFACSIMQSVMELQLEGVYDDLEAVIFSVPCDTLKCMSQKWNRPVPAIVFTHPQNRKIAKDAANVFAREEFNIVKEKLEDILDVHISNKAIKNSIAVYNENRAACREFSDVAAEYAAVVTPSDRHAVIKARWFMEKSRHTALVKELIAALKAEPAPEFKGKKIIVTGIQVEPYDVLDIFQENGFAIVADDLAQETRNFRQDVPDDDDALMALARAWNEFDGCSLATDVNKPKGQMIIDAVKKYGADAVVVCMMKFCDPEEFDYPILLQEFEAAGVKNLYIEVDQESTAFEQVKTRIQTFAEIL
ncbi:MAG: 2-hydroxyacyl-CoA dehydratase family protein [Coprococcus catus]|jgi:bcr-type benzoyl-CoA reductase subunit C|uniref:2-hydroxyacyl-CoA dehydratase family protein n=1 Tax=Coprococcus intestinihominis TaxID=3133154 RepID=A0ABV1B421_9FIRM|nr:2-hydroxyacyl-CoA dehydratase family protein [Coprococcus catus]MDD6342998.1 2-hydroxyacyl-CoA dehydratase family protein [Coprococcus catus]MDY5989159.1 2-hydroxyacyl-CoA dehydratase family protein [Coprococcus catus]